MSLRASSSGTRAVRWPIPALALWLAGVLAGGCDTGAPMCTAADTTYSCCLKQNVANPLVCDGLSELEGMRSLAAVTKKGGGKAAAATAALTLGIKDSEPFVDPRPFEEVEPLVEDILLKCARQAEAEVNRALMKGKSPDAVDCAESVHEDGKTMTRAMYLGLKKHEKARECVDLMLGKEFPGRFALEQRYRYDWKARTRHLEDRKPGRGVDLSGTVVPDVVIHSGNPVEVQAVYDFKFPCPEDNSPQWSTYPRGHPYHPASQGAIYQKIFNAIPRIVAPWWGLI
jgi:hypothetical protein